jgi:hypothetical protein
VETASSVGASQAAMLSALLNAKGFTRRLCAGAQKLLVSDIV